MGARVPDGEALCALVPDSGISDVIAESVAASDWNAVATMWSRFDGTELLR